MPLGEHLSAYHDAWIAQLNFLKLAIKLCIAAGGIAIDAVKRNIGEELG